ncbi:MAG: alkaline phosphatase family protein [Labilithrix sp.]|nr:alkaline phosphatase family protein [Labilithrix sp.]
MSRVLLRNVTMPTYRAVMKVKSRAMLVVLAAIASSCADRGRAVDVREVGPPRMASGSSLLARRVERRPHGVDAPVVLMAIDGVRWQEVFHGADRSLSSSAPIAPTTIFKHLHGLGTERGAFVGAPGHGTIAASGPNYVSLPGYTELLGGRPSACTDNGCARTTLPTILDEAHAAGARVAAFASWDKLDLAATMAPGSFTSSCGRRGDPLVDPWPGHGDYRPDRVTATAALEYYEAEKPDVFFLGLGDADEYAHRGDYPGYLAALRHADETIGRLLALLDRLGDRGRSTHVIVTADHGRASDFKNHGPMPEAARVWMAAVGPRFSARGPVSSPEPRHLADIAPTLRMVLGLPADRSARSGAPLEELF